MSGTGGSPAVFPNQQGVYPLSPMPELSPSPASPVTFQERAAGASCGSPCLHPPSPTPHLRVSPPKSEGSFPPASPPPYLGVGFSPTQELRGGTPPRWETPHLNQQGRSSFMSPAEVSSNINAYPGALVTPKAYYPQACYHPPERKRARVPVVTASYGGGFRPVSRRLLTLAPIGEGDCRMVPGAFQSAAVAASGR